MKSYDPKQESNHITHLNANNLHGYVMPQFFPTCGSTKIDPKEFDLNKYTSNGSKGSVLKVNLEYTKELSVLNNDYLLVPDKMEINREIMSSYQLDIADFYIPIGYTKILVPNFLNKDMFYFENLQFSLRL